MKKGGGLMISELEQRHENKQWFFSYPSSQDAVPVLRARTTTMSRRRERENEKDLPDAVVDDH
jgi:hypothetical protein